MDNFTRSLRILRWVVPVLLAGTLAVWSIRQWNARQDASIVITPDAASSSLAPIPTFTPTTNPANIESPSEEAAQEAALASDTAITGRSTGSEPLQPESTLAPQNRLDEAARLHRYGFYTEEQWTLLAIIASDESSAEERVLARYRLAESFLAEGNYTQALSTLAQFEAETTALPADDPYRIDAIFLQAETLAGLGRAGEAAAAYTAYLEYHPELTEVIFELIAQAYRDDGNAGEAAAAYRRAADTTPDRSTQARLLEAQAAMLERAGRWAEAATVYDEILSFAVNPTYRTTITARAAGAYAEAGNETAAVEHWQTVVNEGAPDGAAHPALVALVERNIAVDLMRRGSINLLAGAYLPAIAAFEGFIAQNPDDPQIGEALHGIGQSYLALGNFAQAQSYLDRVTSEYPACACFGQAWIDKARLAILSGEDAEGRRIYRTFAREHAEDALAPEALWLSALSAISADNPIEAAVDIWALADAFPGSERAPNALYVLGIGSITNRAYPQAVASFTRMQNDYPEARSQAVAYWLGRAHAAQGETAEAEAQWQALVEREPDTHYGVLAGLALQGASAPGEQIFAYVDDLSRPASTLAGDDGSQAFAESWLAERIGVAVDQLSTLPADIAADADLQTGTLLLRLDRRGEALAFLQRVADRHNSNLHGLYALALYFEDLGTYGLSINAATRLMSLSGARLIEDIPSFIQRLAYPIHFDELIYQEAEANGLDPRLFSSLIRQESLFEEGARSYAAAQGLSQIIPSTGAEIAERLNYPGYSNDLIYRPHINVRFGAFYLDWVRDYVDGNLAAALAGYNAGPGNARTWQSLANGDDALFVELMTYAEPRLYIQRILSNYYHYTRLYD